MTNIHLKNTHSQDGYIALISAIIITAILFSIFSALSFISYFARLNILEGEYKDQSSALADACVDIALAKFAASSVYTGNETISVNGSDLCVIRPIGISGPPFPQHKIIEVQVSKNNFYTNVSVTVSPSSLIVSSWREVPNF